MVPEALAGHQHLGARDTFLRPCGRRRGALVRTPRWQTWLREESAKEEEEEEKEVADSLRAERSFGITKWQRPTSSQSLCRSGRHMPSSSRVAATMETDG